MIQIIAGKKGSGKTKRLIDMTNNAVKTSSGNVVFLDGQLDQALDDGFGVFPDQRPQLANLFVGRRAARWIAALTFREFGHFILPHQN